MIVSVRGRNGKRLSPPVGGPHPEPSVRGGGEPMGRSVNWGRMSHVVPGASWPLAQDTSMVPAGAGLAGWAWAE